MSDVRDHWDAIYAAKAADEVSWYQADPARSAVLIAAHAADRASGIIDIGSGRTRLIAALLARGYVDLTALDVSATAITKARSDLGASELDVAWVRADIRSWMPNRRWDLWHDRAVFHFLIEPVAQEAYIRAMSAALAPGARAVIATFAEDGPERCSGLPVQRYSPASLAERLGSGFRLIEDAAEAHMTPRGAEQRFLYAVFERRDVGVPTRA